jgi:hypothetical protein
MPTPHNRQSTNQRNLKQVGDQYKTELSETSTPRAPNLRNGSEDSLRAVNLPKLPAVQDPTGFLTTDAPKSEAREYAKLTAALADDRATPTDLSEKLLLISQYAEECGRLTSQFEAQFLSGRRGAARATGKELLQIWQKLDGSLEVLYNVDPALKASYEQSRQKITDCFTLLDSTPFWIMGFLRIQAVCSTIGDVFTRGQKRPVTRETPPPR